MSDSPTELSYECIDATPIAYDFGTRPWGDEPGCWQIAPGSIWPDAFESEILDSARCVAIDMEDFEISVTTFQDGEVAEVVETFDPSDGEPYDRHARALGLDPDQIRRVVDGDDVEDWMPIVNLVYALGQGELPDNWKALVCNTTIILVNGDEDEYFLAQTGCGMDFGWELCASFLALGRIPPACLASKLPAMAGRGDSGGDRAIIDGCRRSLEATRDRCTRGLERLDDLGDN